MPFLWGLNMTCGINNTSVGFICGGKPRHISCGKTIYFHYYCKFLCQRKTAINKKKKKLPQNLCLVYYGTIKPLQLKTLK